MTAALDLSPYHDYRWRVSNLYEIVDKRGQRVPFRLNSAQEQLLEGLTGRDVIPKARQLGVTTLMS
ncbi:MAG: hypothetical protein D6773_08540, partial [Alphaproteobacteria bacterium]